MKTLLFLLTIAITLIGCGANAEQSQVEATDSTQASHPETTAGAPTQPGPGSITGKIAETMTAGGYTYMLIERDSESTWVAVPQTTVEVGQEVTVSEQMTMVDFESKSLNRTFDSLVFATMGGPAMNPHAGMQGMGMPKPAVSDMGDISIEKAEGANARTVAEIFAERSVLADNSVVVRGKVVKFNAQIMGRNWIHLQDGSGSAEEGTHDLTITTDATVAVGDVVTVSGLLKIDQDFGAGYIYPVIVDNATLAN